MKSRLLRLSAWCALALALAAGTALAAEPRLHFIRPGDFNLGQILGSPPAPGSEKTRDEIGLVLERQATRTPADEARIDREGKWSPLLFDDVLGAWFTGQNLPVTISFLDAVGRDTMDVCEAAKKKWNRPRPPAEDQRVHPSVGLPTSSSYPSGHGAYGLVLATVLGELAPDLKEPLRRRGEQIGDDRVEGGVHFPSDVEAARTLGRAILTRLNANPEFRGNLEKAKAEFQAVRSRLAANPVPGRVKTSP